MHDREFTYTPADFERVCRLVYQWAGIKLSDAKQDMVYSRLVRHVRTNGFKSFREYLDGIEKASPEGRQNFINALTTNLTYFFRENHHFERLKQWLGERAKESGKITIWCAASSTGEEPYSIAMTVCEYFQTLRPPVELIASDLDTNVLKFAQEGSYPFERASKLNESRLKTYFMKGSGEPGSHLTVRPELRSLIQFKQINLLDPAWAMLQNRKFDAIFCRNVMIYFDRETQEKLIRRMRKHINSEGLLFVGHSETLHYATDCFKSLGNTVYKPI